MRWSLVLFAGLVIASACTKTQTCQASCEGCCDAQSNCLAGTTRDACGAGGATCAACVVHTNCFGRSCQLDPNSVDGGGAGGGGGGGTGGGGGGDAGLSADAGLTEYPDGGSLSRYWDGGSCAVKTDCPCFSSDDCGPTFYCHSEDSSGLNIYCVPGARGAGLAGATCAGEADCLSALCTDSTSSGMKCSALCDLAAECPPTLPRCTFIGFGVDRSICAP